MKRRLVLRAALALLVAAPSGARAQETIFNVPSGDGGQFGLEQPVNSRLTLAADWYTGHHALGYVTPGVIVKLTSRITWYGSYQIGNGAVANGNHQFLTELGWNFN